MKRDRPATYAIWVQGALDAEWADRLGGLHVRQVRAGAQPMTELVGDLVDQTALAGVLTTLYELGLPIISVDRLVELSHQDQTQLGGTGGGAPDRKRLGNRTGSPSPREEQA